MKLKQISEGKALTLNKDQEEFVEEAATAIEQWFNKSSQEEKEAVPYIPLDDINFDEFPVIYIREVVGKTRSGISDRKNVEVSIAWTGQRGGNGVMDTSGKPRLVICLYRERQDYYGISSDTMRNILRHELVHIFDPKLSSMPEWERNNWEVTKNFFNKAEYKNKTGDIQNYSQLPWEQDAGMYQHAFSRLAKIKDKLKEDKTLLAKLQPITPWEEDWHKQPKQWRKYLTTIYYLAKKANLI